MPITHTAIAITITGSETGDTLAAAQVSPIHADIRKVNNITVDGAGTEADPFGPA